MTPRRSEAGFRRSAVRILLFVAPMVASSALLIHGAMGGAGVETATSLPVEIVNDTLGVADRCARCHTGLLGAGSGDRSPAARPHPGGYFKNHDPARFGCVVCHGGNGRGTTKASAHGPGPDGKAVVSGPAVEVACVKCHPDGTHLEGAPHLSEGRRLIRRLNCASCHAMQGVTRRQGEDLRGLADRVTPEWCFVWLRSPKDYAENASMPRYELDDRMRDALVGYLLTFKEKASFDASRFGEGDADRGGKLFRLSFCISCHTVDGKGASEAIDLGRVGNKLNRTELLRILSETHRTNPGTAMPQYRLSDPQTADLAAYLLDNLYDPSFADPEVDTVLTKMGSFWASESLRVDTGRRLFKELRCGNCHAFPDDGRWIWVGPDLRRLDSDVMARVREESSWAPPTLQDYVVQKILDPRRFEPAPYRFKMPNYDLNRESALAISIAVLGQIQSDPVFESFMVHSPEDDDLALTGEFGELVDKYRCYSCHSFDGIGHNTTYDLGLEGSRVKKEWLIRYLKEPYTLRPLLTIRMPIFNLSDHEARVLAEGLMETQTNPSIEQRGGFLLTAAMVGQGRALFERNHCMSCHQVGAAGGYVGPSFTAGSPVGGKLRPGWIMAWLEDPCAIVPGTVEPRYDFTLEERRAICAYLMSINGQASDQR